MKTSDLYIKKKDCCGCELCSHLCPKNIIKMIPDCEGFLYPSITDNSNCIDCGICIKKCPIKTPRHNNPISSIEHFAGFNINDEEIKLSASGGLATALGKVFILENGVVYGVCYSLDFMSALYERADNLNTLNRFRGSKYIQAVKGNLYERVKKDLNESRKVLVVGLPCEISALYSYLGDNTTNLYTVVLICHGPTSPRIQEEYCKSLINLYKAKPSSFSVRYKKLGWKPYFIKSVFPTGTHIEQFNQTDYNTAFLYLKRPSCNSCSFKLGGTKGIHADLIIGDYHLASKGMKEYNRWGCSQASVLTQKGDQLLQSVSADFSLFPISAKNATKYNLGLVRPFPAPLNRLSFSSTFAKKSLHDACVLPSVILIETVSKYKLKLMSGIINVLKTIIKHLK